MSVLLPAPFSPQSATTLPASAENDTSRRARTPPKLLEICRISSRTAPAAPAGSEGCGPWFMSGSVRQRHGVMNLPGDLDETDRRVEMPADRILFERLDLGHGHAG